MNGHEIWQRPRRRLIGSVGILTAVFAVIVSSGIIPVDICDERNVADPGGDGGRNDIQILHMPTVGDGNRIAAVCQRLQIGKHGIDAGKNGRADPDQFGAVPIKVNVCLDCDIFSGQKTGKSTFCFQAGQRRTAASLGVGNDIGKAVPVGEGIQGILQNQGFAVGVQPAGSHMAIFLEGNLYFAHGSLISGDGKANIKGRSESLESSEIGFGHRDAKLQDPLFPVQKIHGCGQLHNLHPGTVQSAAVIVTQQKLSAIFCLPGRIAVAVGIRQM